MNNNRVDFGSLLKIALDEARKGRDEGGIPIGAVLFKKNGDLLGVGHNRRVQNGDPSAHAEIDAFRNAGRQINYRDKILVTTLSPCWYCCGLVKQFRIGTVIIGESVNFSGGQDWLKENGFTVVDLHSEKCIELLRTYITENPKIWNEDIGEI